MGYIQYFLVSVLYFLSYFLITYLIGSGCLSYSLLQLFLGYLRSSSVFYTVVKLAINILLALESECFVNNVLHMRFPFNNSTAGLSGRIRKYSSSKSLAGI